jgi:NAD(P)-dependent dehydrogenase (short-subunit alcohol dehydrogenase family)
MTDLDGKTAVVTGAASGNGQAIALRFAAAGADIVVADIRMEPREGGTPTHDRISEHTDSNAEYVSCDVTSIPDLERAVERADEFGGIDVMVNNAGIFRMGDFLETSEAEFSTIMDVNVRGVFFGAQAAARKMGDCGGAILNISSTAGIQGNGHHVTYSASKGAVRVMTYALADALGPAGIRVNAIHPGITKTSIATEDLDIIGSPLGEHMKDRIPLGRFGEPYEIAEAALYLVSDAASYVNGESLVLDGGMTNTG